MIPRSSTQEEEVVDLDDDVCEERADGMSNSNTSVSSTTSSQVPSMRIKVRQHVNPLAAQYLVPITLDKDWISKAYTRPTQPFIIDIGCAKGGWPIKYCQTYPDTNVLGLEIRRPVVDYCLARKAYWGLNNVHFLSMNANVDLERIMANIGEISSVEMVMIQFPDPHFKSRNKKRRVVNADLVDTIGMHTVFNYMYVFNCIYECI